MRPATKWMQKMRANLTPATPDDVPKSTVTAQEEGRRLSDWLKTHGAGYARPYGRRAVRSQRGGEAS